MTTMTNTMNTICKPAHITMRCTIVNGESWDLLLNVSPLTEEEITPVLNCLVNGGLDPRFDTPKINEFIQGVTDGAAEVLMRFCFDGGEYDHFYAVKLISDVVEVGLCCEECCAKEMVLLHQLFAEYLAGSETAVQRIAQNLYDFFADTMPFVFDVI